jgi:hypothetical protein
MVGSWCGWYWWEWVLTGHIWEAYGALQHKNVAMREEKLIIFVSQLIR